MPPPRSNHSRSATTAAGIAKAEAEGAKPYYDNYVIFGDPPPSDAGGDAIGGNVLLNQLGTHAFAAHELGHLLGLDHPFGPDPGDTNHEYTDPYCVMGQHFVSTFRLAPPSVLADLSPGNPVLEASRRPSTATLFKYVPGFASSASVHHAPPVIPGGSSEHDLVAASDARIGRDPLMVEMMVEPPMYASPYGRLLLEYRRPKPDDWDRGIGDPVVLMHSTDLARHQVPGATHYARLSSRGVWLLGAIKAAVGNAWADDGLDLGVEVVSASADQSRVRVRIASMDAMEAGVRIDPVQWSNEANPQIDVGSISPPPIGNCELGTYPYTTTGTSVTALIRATTHGISQPVMEWSLWTGYTSGSMGRLTGSVNTDLQTTRRVAHTHIEGAVTTTRSTPIVMDYRLGSDGSLTLRKDEHDGAFTLTVRLKVTGSNPRFGAVERKSEVDVSFPGDELQVGGTYLVDSAHCRGVFDQAFTRRPFSSG